MKYLKRLSILTLLISSLTLSGCNVTHLPKEEIKYTYSTLQNHSIFNVDALPNTGNPKLLVVPVWFTDSNIYIRSQEDKRQIRKDIETAYFGTAEECGWQSVSSFYEEESYGNVKLTGVVTDWYEIGQSVANYSRNLDNIMNAVKSAVEWYKTESGDTTMTSFDTDHNGYLDGVILVYGAPDYVAMDKPSAEYLWAFTYWLQDTSKDVNNPNPNTFFWASFDFMYGKKNGFPYHDGDTRFQNIDTHTFIHEMGHVFGLDDYYDYSNQYSPAAAFSMQDFNVGGHDPYSVMALGWTKPYVPTKSCTIKIKDFRSSGDLILLSPEFHNSPFDEYLLLELYTPTGLNEFDTFHSYQYVYPRGVETVGIRLWHVDGRLIHKHIGSETELIYNPTSDILPGEEYTHLMSNTYYDEDVVDYCSPLGKDYADYNLLQLIRNSKTVSDKTLLPLLETDLFKKGDSFSMEKFKKQFVNGTKLNAGIELNWSFTVTNITKNTATIKVIKG